MGRIAHALEAELPADALSRKLLEGTGEYVGLQLVSLGLAYVSQLLMARWLQTSDFGFVSLAVTVSVLLSNVAALGFGTGVERFLPDYAEGGSWGKARGLVRRATQLPLLAGAVAVGIGAPLVFATSLEHLEKLSLCLGLALVPLLAVSANLSGGLQALGRTVAAYLPDDVVAPLVTMAGFVVLYLVFDDLGPIHALGLMLVVHLVVVAVQAVWLRRSLPRDYFAAAPAYKTKEWLGTTLPVMIMTLFGIVIYRADLILVGHLRGASEAGIYAVVLSTSEFLQMFLKGTRSVASPHIAPLLKKGDRAGFQRLMTMVARYAFAPTLVGAAIIAVAAPRILDLFGKGFDAGTSALMVMIGAQLVRSFFGGPATALLFSGHQVRVAQVYSVTMLVDLALLFLLIPRLGMLGASLASFATVALSQLILAVLAYREAGVASSILGRRVVKEIT